jgi:hypothetical protein
MSQTLVDFLSGLLRDGGRRAEFSADPGATLARHGLAEPSPQNIYDALVRIGDDQDLGRRPGDVLNIPPPPPPAYFAGHTGDGAGVRYLDNYVSGLDDAQGPFTGSSDAHGEPGLGDPGYDVPAYDDGADPHGTDPHGADPHGYDPHGLDAGTDHGGYEPDA